LEVLFLVVRTLAALQSGGASGSESPHYLLGRVRLSNSIAPSFRYIGNSLTFPAPEFVTMRETLSKTWHLTSAFVSRQIYNADLVPQRRG